MGNCCPFYRVNNNPSRSTKHYNFYDIPNPCLDIPTQYTFGDTRTYAKCVDVHSYNTISVIIPTYSTFYKYKCIIRDVDNIISSKIKLRELLQDRIVYVKCYKRDSDGYIPVDLYLQIVDMMKGENSISELLYMSSSK